MQKAYSRINWKDEPSLDTPLGANNLNKMDSALDVIDNRVLSLSGYEGRVQASEKNAKASEVNAKTSENNAKESEELARDYAERAFNTTPEGYEQIVDTVQKMDIKESADTTLLDSKAGGYKLLSMSGNSVQNGTPTPDAPQSIHNVGDCVEMMQGTLSSSNGEWVTSTTRICSKNPIPCKSGDVVRIETESSKGLLLVAYYNEGGFVSVSNLANVSVANFTVPTNVTKFKIVVGDNNGITPDTVGKISLTINGKYVVQIVEENKNLWEWGDVSGINEIVKKYKSLPIGTYTLSYVTSATSGNMNVQIGDANGSYLINKSTQLANFNTRNSVTFTITSQAEFIRFYSDTQTTLSSIQLERGEVMTDYEVYKEKVATVLLNAPLRDTDVMSRTEVNRFFDEYVFTGAESEIALYEASGRQVRRFALKDEKLFAYPNNDVIPLSNYFVGVPFNSQQDLGVFFQKNYLVFTDVNNKWADANDFKSWLAERYASGNPVVVYYPRATPIAEILDSTSQSALNSLETFDSVTYINVDSITQPKGINGEYGTSKVGARTIKNELKNDTLEIKYNELAVALVATESGV